MAAKEVLVPDLGSFKDVVIIDVLVKPGDRIEVDTPLLTLETDKATMDVPSTAAGVIEKLLVKTGDKVSEGSAIATVQTEGGAAPAQAPAAPAKAPAAPAKSAPAPAAAAPATTATPAATAPAPTPASQASKVDEAAFAKAHASPSVRQLARELGVDLGRVTGTADKGRITQDDVKGYVKKVLSGAAALPASGGGVGGGSLPRVPVVDFAAFGPVEIKPLTRIQKISGPRLHASWVNLPHITQYDLADITDMEEARKWVKYRAAAEGIKMTPLAFIIRAAAKALKQFPRFNASLDAAGENLVYKQYCHIGFAADTPNGLVVPVIRDADKKDVFALARSLGELSDKARKGKLSGADMQGGCFTISSLGGIGGTAFTPIVNAPEVAILGVSKSSMQPVWKDNAFVPRLMLPLCLSYDHRVIDGADGARFITFLSQALADVGSLMEAVA